MLYPTELRGHIVFSVIGFTSSALQRSIFVTYPVSKVNKKSTRPGRDRRIRHLQPRIECGTGLIILYLKKISLMLMSYNSGSTASQQLSRSRKPSSKRISRRKNRRKWQE